MNRPDSGIRWKRIALITASLTLCSAFAIYFVLSLTQARLPPAIIERPINTQQVLREAQGELDGSIDWLNHDGYPVTSLRAKCDASSSDTMQFFDSPGMDPLGHIVVYVRLRENKLTTVEHFFDASKSKYSSKDSTVNSEGMQSLWSAADRIITTAPTAHEYEMFTDASTLTLEVCRHGHYFLVSRYMGTNDPDNAALFELFDRSKRLSDGGMKL